MIQVLEAEGTDQDGFEFLGLCSHCGEGVWTSDDAGECRHGISHAECMIDNGCEIA